MQNLISRFFLSLAVLAYCFATVEASSLAEKLPEWKPAPELLPKLSEPVQAKFGSIRIPLGLKKSTQHDKSAPADAYIWESSSKEPGLRRALILVDPPISAEMSGTYTLQRVLDEFLVGFSRRFDNFKITPRQYGHINNNPAAKIRWSGTPRNYKEEAKGSLFAIRRDKKLFVILCTQKSDDDEWGQLLEAAVLTFQPK